MQDAPNTLCACVDTHMSFVCTSPIWGLRFDTVYTLGAKACVFKN